MKTTWRLATLAVMLMSAAQSFAAVRDQGCTICARPEIDWRRYVNVAYNVYFVRAKYYESRPQNRVVGDQILIRGSKGCFGPKRDWVLVNFKYNWENLDGEIGVGPFGARVSLPIFHNNIEWIGQIPDGTQRAGNFLANSGELRWRLHALPYAPGATDCPQPDEPGDADHDQYKSVEFPWGDGLECLSRDSVFEIITCAIDRGFRCTCGGHDGHYTCIKPGREGLPLP